MRFSPWLLSALAALALSSSIFAEELTTPAAPQESAAVPARGSSMDKVQAQFGEPSNRVPAVGNPPIARWEYPGFVVYFEHHLVIHSVARG